MQKLNSIILKIILISLIIVPIVSFAQTAIHRTNCCKLSYTIQLDNVDICNPIGCDPDVAGCCTRQATYTFNQGQNIGPAEAGVIQCWLGSSQVAINVASPHWGMVCLMNTINTITDVVFWFALALSVIMGVLTGFFFITAAGEPSKIERAKGMLIWLVVGIAIAVSAKLIAALIQSVIL
ncbi:MAG: pilin [Patescibacteria group bacterium]